MRLWLSPSPPPPRSLWLAHHESLKLRNSDDNKRSGGAGAGVVSKYAITRRARLSNFLHLDAIQERSDRRVGQIQNWGQNKQTSQQTDRQMDKQKEVLAADGACRLLRHLFVSSA